MQKYNQSLLILKFHSFPFQNIYKIESNLLILYYCLKQAIHRIQNIFPFPINVEGFGVSKDCVITEFVFAPAVKAKNFNFKL